MSLIDMVIGVMAPFDCLACGREGSLLCPVCRRNLPPAPAFAHRLPAVASVRSATVYGGLAKELLWRLKAGGAQGAARVMAGCMLPLVPVGFVVVPVPTASVRARSRGYDQARLLARRLSSLSGQPYFECLSRIGQAHQVGANRAQRLRQLQTAFRVKRNVTGLSILLIDDVVTTGASLQAAAEALRQAGAGHVEAATFAQA